ncbi:MAG: hypothetical protein Q7S86_03455 [bacterium]|nr:hypothetical protein [bacterium]
MPCYTCANMADIVKKEKAQILRKEGLGINEIAEVLNASKSTVSYWCKDIELTQTQINRLRQKQKNSGIKALFATFEKKRQQRILSVNRLMQEGRREVQSITKRELFLLGLALYWAEGYKKGNEEVGFTNGDSKIIRLIIKWFRVCYQVDPNNFILRVSINELHRNRVNEVVDYWVKETSLCASQFTKTSLIKTKSKKIYSDISKHFGTVRIKVRRGANLRRRILGSLEALGDIEMIE